MFNFLNPTFLTIGAAAAALPILIHLLLRNKTVKIDFAAMRFLLDSKKPMVRWLKLRQFLILLLRILAAAVIALAFARPFLTEGKSLAIFDSNAREVGIIVDVSASLGAADHLQTARQKLESLFTSLEDGVPVSVYFAGGGGAIVAEKEPNSTALKARVLTALKPSHESSNLREALQVIDDILRGSAILRREIYIISDFQKSAWPTAGGFLTLASQADVTLLPTAEKEWANAAIVDAHVPERAGEYWACTVRDFSGSRIKRASIKLVLGGKAIGSRTVNLTENATRVVKFDQAKKRLGALTGYFELTARNDAFAADNRYYFSAGQKKAVQVLAVNGERANGASDELFFARRAINAKGSPFKLIATDPLRLNNLDPQAFDIVLLANVKGLNKKSLAAIKTFVQKGGGLLIAAGDKLDPAYFNNFFAGIIPATLVRPAQAKVDRSSGQILLINDTEHPATRMFADPASGDLSAARFYQYWKVEPREGAQVLAGFTDGSPAILARGAGRGKVIFLAFPLDGEWSDFPIQPSYLPLLYSMLTHLEPPHEKRGRVTVGQPVFLGDIFSLQQAIMLRAPDGQESVLKAGENVYADTEQPGIYRFRQERAKKTVAINMPVQESETRLILPEAFLARLDTGDSQTTIDGARLTASITDTEAESSQKLWKIMLLFACVLILTESFLANRTPR